MTDTSIRVENLSKLYRIGKAQQRHDTLRDALVAGLRAPLDWLRRNGSGPNDAEDTIWALKDVSFEVKRGEVAGIIGRNGAGKSTLLKILSRITEPTEGRAVINGRVGSLLEVGTGFHPELTGRENIYLNGAILGMRRAEIDRKFDEIVAFAEVERFIDTPVKRYSSGMYVRLAFAVAARLETEILLVDEVLAVGDAAFQKRCLAKMGDISEQGRTVLFVSHNMAAVQTLCTRSILLQQGAVQKDDTVSASIDAYLKSMEQRLASQDLSARVDRWGKGQIRLTRVEIAAGEGSAVLITGRSSRFVFWLTEALPATTCAFTLYNQFGQPVVNFDSAIHSLEDLQGSATEPRFVCEIHELLLTPGRYRLNVMITGDGEVQDHVEAAAIFEVGPGQLGGRPIAMRGGGAGNVCMPHRWITPS